MKLGSNYCEDRFSKSSDLKVTSYSQLSKKLPNLVISHRLTDPSNTAVYIMICTYLLSQKINNLSIIIGRDRSTLIDKRGNSSFDYVMLFVGRRP